MPLFGGGIPGPVQQVNKNAPFAGPGSNYNPQQGAHAGVIAQYQNQSSSPYWNQWLQDLAANKLEGSDAYFFDRYAQQHQGADALQKQQDVAQSRIQGQVGDLQGQLQENMASRGLGRSGLMAEGMGRIAGGEQQSLDDLKARIDADRMKYNQGLQLDWAAQKEDEKARNDRKRQRRYGTASTILGTAGGIAGLALGGPMGGMFGSQLGSSVLGGGQ